jgi:hypothetical protein
MENKKDSNSQAIGRSTVIQPKEVTAAVAAPKQERKTRERSMKKGNFEY